MTTTVTSSAGSDFLYNLSLADKLYKASSINEAKDVYIAATKLLISRQQAQGDFDNEVLSSIEAAGVAAAVANLADIHLNRSNDSNAEETNTEIVSLVVSLFPPKRSGFGIFAFDSKDLNDRMATECATILINESDWRRDQGDYRSSRALIMLAHDICSKNVLPDHPVFAECISCEASIMLAEGHYVEALQLAETGLAARMKHYPDSHLAIAASYYLKAKALISLGRYDEALQLIALSIEIRKTNLGQDHPAVAQCIYCQAVIREIQGYPLEALQELKVTLDLRSGHANTPAGSREITESILALAINSERRGEFKKAQDLYERALKLVLQQLAGRGTIESIDVADILVHLGNLYRIVGRYTDAAAMLGRSGIMICRLYDDQHLKLGDCLYALAELAKATGQYHDAKVLLSRCVTLRKGKLDATHPLIAAVLHATAENLWYMGFYSDASELGDSALVSRVGVFGEEHPDVASSLLLRGCILRDIGEPSSAMKIMNRVLSLIRARLGGSHPLVATTLREIAECLRMLERYDDAEQAVSEALRLRKAAYIEAFQTATEDSSSSSTSGSRNNNSATATTALLAAGAAPRSGGGSRDTSSPIMITGIAEVADCLSCLGRIYIGRKNWQLARVVFEDAALPMFLQAFGGNNNNNASHGSRSSGTLKNGGASTGNDDGDKGVGGAEGGYVPPDEHPQLIMARGCLGIAMAHDRAADKPAGEQMVYDALSAFKRHKRAWFSSDNQWVKFLGGYPAELTNVPDGFQGDEIEEFQQQADETEQMRREEEWVKEQARLLELNIDRERVNMDREEVLSRHIRVLEMEQRAKELADRLHKEYEDLMERKKLEEEGLAKKQLELQEKAALEEAEFAARAAALAAEQERQQQENEQKARELVAEERRIVILAATEMQKKQFGERIEVEEKKLIHVLAIAEAVQLQEHSFDKHIREQEIDLAKQRIEIESDLMHCKQEHEVELTRRQRDSELFVRTVRDEAELKIQVETIQEDFNSFRGRWKSRTRDDENNHRKNLSEALANTKMAVHQEVLSVQSSLRDELTAVLQLYEDWRSEHNQAVAIFESTLGPDAILKRLGQETREEDVEKLRSDLEIDAKLSREILTQQARHGIEAHERRLKIVEEHSANVLGKIDIVSSAVTNRVVKEKQLMRYKFIREIDLINQSSERRLMQSEDDVMKVILRIEEETLLKMEGAKGKAELAREARERRDMSSEETYEKQRITVLAVLEAERAQREAKEAVARERERESGEIKIMRREELQERKRLAEEAEAAHEATLDADERLRIAREREEKRIRDEEKELAERALEAVETKLMGDEETYEWNRLEALRLAALAAEEQLRVAREIEGKRRLEEDNELCLVEKEKRRRDQEEEKRRLEEKEKRRREEEEELRIAEEKRRLEEEEKHRRLEEEELRITEDKRRLEEEEKRRLEEEEKRLRLEEEEELRMAPIRCAKEQALMEVEEQYERSRLALIAFMVAEAIRKEIERMEGELALMKVEDDAGALHRQYLIELAHQLKVLQAMETEAMSAEDAYARLVEIKDKEDNERRRLEAEEARRLAVQVADWDAMAAEEKTGITNRKLLELEIVSRAQELVRQQEEAERLLRERLDEERRRILVAQKEREENDRKRREARQRRREEDELRTQQSRELQEKEMLETQHRAKAYKFNFGSVCAGLRDDLEEPSPEKSLGSKLRESPFSTPLKISPFTTSTRFEVNPLKFSPTTTSTSTAHADTLFFGNMREESPRRRTQTGSSDEELAAALLPHRQQGKRARAPRSAYGERSRTTATGPGASPGAVSSTELDGAASGTGPGSASRRRASTGYSEPPDEFADHILSATGHTMTSPSGKEKSPGQQLSKPIAINNYQQGEDSPPMTSTTVAHDRRRVLGSAPAGLSASSYSYSESQVINDGDAGLAAGRQAKVESQLATTSLSRTTPLAGETGTDSALVDGLAPGSSRWGDRNTPAGISSRKLLGQGTPGTQTHIQTSVMKRGGAGVIPHVVDYNVLGEGYINEHFKWAKSSSKNGGKKVVKDSWMGDYHDPLEDA